MKRLLVLAIALAAVGGPGTAHAATPCRDRVYNEWYATGKISTRHPVACYRDALRHIPADAAVYSDLDSSIKQALQAALARQRSSSDPARMPSSVGTGFTTPSGPHQTKAARKTKRDPSPRHEPRAQSIAPVAATSSGGGGGLPMPIIVLGGIAAALAAAGAIGLGVRHLRQ